MKIVIAPDSFKGSLSAKEVCEAIESGILQYISNAEIVKVPMADGGEGTVETLVDATGGRIKVLKVRGPMGHQVEASFGILGDGYTAVIEMASASGLTLVAPMELNPLLATTYGTGELIKAALDEGCRKFIIGIGGSATNDGGVGMAQALGVSFKDVAGKEIGPGGGSLAELDRIDVAGIDARVLESDFRVACDVAVPLCGEQGASYIFGPQKGATPDMVKRLDENLNHLAAVVNRDLGKDVKNIPGTGAAGGMGYGLIAFCGAQLARGSEIIVEATDLKKKMEGAQLIITGEGQMDGQTSHGKTAYGVAMAAKEKGIPVVAIVGSIGRDADKMYNYGINTMFSIVTRPQIPLEECISNARKMIADTACRLIRAIAINLN